MLDEAPAPTIGAEPPALAAIPAPAAAPAADDKPKRSRSGTSGAERARRKRAEQGTAPRDSAPRSRAVKVPPLEQRLAESLVLVGTLVGSFVNEYDGAVIVHNAPRASGVLAGIAERKPAFARLLESILAVGDNVDGAAVLVGMLVPILVNHGVIPARFAIVATVMGTAPPVGTTDADAAALRDLAASFTAPPTAAPAA